MSKWSRDEKKAFTVLAGWSFGLILFITAANSFLILNSFRKVEEPNEVRNIASVKSQVPLKGPKAPLMQWDCQLTRQRTSLTTKSPSARILIRNCPPVKALKNKSNQGYAHLFPLEKDTWTSDFIQLKEGSNNIQIEWGGSRQILKITRKIPPSLTANKEL